MRPVLRKYSAIVFNIVFHAQRLHQGVYCMRTIQDPMTGEWRYMHLVAKGAVLLAVVVDALGAILQMVVETVRYLRSGSGSYLGDFTGPTSSIKEHGNEAYKLLKAARDQLIREADGRDKNGNIGPVVTPEAITTALLEGLVSGVDHAGAIDIIHLYEESLEHLVCNLSRTQDRN